MFVDKTWPAVPRPLPMEVFGSWLGRAASRYKMGVDDLVQAAGLDIEIGPKASYWLGAQPRSASVLTKLARLTRLKVEDLEQMLAYTDMRDASYCCCFRCLVMNPWEIESPYWRLEWMEYRRICEHGYNDLEPASPYTLRQTRNMHRLVNMLGSRRRRRAWNNRDKRVF